jgi:hypothetical protein
MPGDRGSRREGFFRTLDAPGVALLWKASLGATMDVHHGLLARDRCRAAATGPGASGAPEAVTADDDRAAL